MNKNKKISLVIGMFLFLGVGFLIGAYLNSKNVQGANPSANTAGEPVVLIGSKSGTTTTGASFYTRTASTTYPFRIGADKDNVILYLRSLATSTAVEGGDATFSILASNDNDCNTASTTTGILNPVLTHDINWYDASNLVKNATGLTSLPSATTTFAFPTNGTKGRELILENVNSKCLAVEVSASSTVLYAEFMAK